MSVSPRFLEDLRSRLTLSDVIGKRIKLTRAGREYKGCCPFHREKTPSFYVNDEKQFFHCFGCGAHGDILGFVTRHDNLSFIEAVEALAAQAGMPMPKPSREDQEQSKRDKTLYTLCEDAAQWFEDQLASPSNREVLEYCRKRGLSDDTISSFRMGYAPSNDQALRSYLASKGYKDALMIEAGVIKPSTKGGEPYAFFRDRVIFPVADGRGRIVAFGGRILPEHMRPPSRSDFTPPKYINSADTPLFHKGRTLYAGQHARMAAKDQHLLVVEGYMDVIACHQAGCKGAVAPLGTALTEEQIMLLWKMIPLDNKEPILCFDGDEAGYRAAVRASERLLPLLKPSHSVRFMFLPEGDDPDTYIRENGKDAFVSLMDRAIPLIEFLWTNATAGKTFPTPELRSGLSEKLEGMVAKIPDKNLQYHYRQAFREHMDGLFGRNWKNPATSQRRKDGGMGVGNVVQVILPPVGKNQAELVIPQILLLCLINYPALYSYIHDDISRIDMGNDDLTHLQEAIIGILESEEPDELDSDALISHINARSLSEICARLRTSERVRVHAGVARAGQELDVVLEGWKSLMKQLDKSQFAADVHKAREALARAMTEENESRILALKQMQMELNEDRD